jgi:N6-adenosine-specific RNA methylase IME4
VSKSSVNTRAEVAKIARVSQGNIAKTEYILKHATEPVKEQLRRGEVATGKVYQDLKNQERRENIKTTAAVMPDGVFNVIYADCPWKYDHSRSESRAINNHYPQMELEDIKNLQIPAAEDAVLFLWATAPKFREAFEVMEAWGFEYKTNAIWDKEDKLMGNYFRIQHEILLIGKKGNMRCPEPENREDSVHRERRGEHSEKPDYYNQVIEKMYPHGKYLELFARRRYSDKWAVYGNQVSEE